MPLGDGTGPLGKGPQTGRSLGKCPMPGTKEATECRILKHLLMREVSGECEAADIYSTLSEQARKAGLDDIYRNLLLEIGNDEKHHNETLQKIITDLDHLCPD